MIRTNKLFAAAAFAFIAAATAIGFLAAPFNASANAASGQIDPVSDRIGAAFVVATLVDDHPTVRAAANRADKGDLGVPLACVGHAWPNVPAECLATADGAPAADARFVTLGYSGEAQTILLRLPTTEIASR